MKYKYIFCLSILLMLLFSACGIKADDSSIPNDPAPELSSKPLEFFRGSFHDEYGFTFDGFTITADYNIMEERLALTEQQPEIELADNGNTTTLTFYEVSLEEDPGVVGNVSYMFYKEQFLRGSMSILFSDYEAARDFIWELEEELNTVKIPVSELEQQMEEGYEGYVFQDLREPEEWEAPSYSAGYVDRRGISMQTSAAKKILEGGKEAGVVTIFFIENVSGAGGTRKNNSHYFDFEDLGE